MSFYEKESLAMEYVSMATIGKDNSLVVSMPPSLLTLAISLAVHDLTNATSQSSNSSNLDQMLASLRPLHEIYSQLSSPPPEVTSGVCVQIVLDTAESSSGPTAECGLASTPAADYEGKEALNDVYVPSINIKTMQGLLKFLMIYTRRLRIRSSDSMRTH